MSRQSSSRSFSKTPRIDSARSRKSRLGSESKGSLNFFKKKRDTQRIDEENKKLNILYKNWRGETSWRVVIPIEMKFAVSEWHGDEPSWLMVAMDVEKGVEREFKMVDVLKIDEV